MRIRLMLFIAAGFLAGAALSAGALYYAGKFPPQQGAVREVSGKAAVGGPFALTDHTGRRVSEETFRGQYMLVYFGFTYCPDVCPAELQIMTSALDRLGEKAKRVQPVFITVDPERDTVEQMASYVPQFSDRLIGLTGTPEEIRKAAKAYRVYYEKVEEDESTSGGYTMDHTSIVYLMGPDGDYVDHFSTGTGPEAMAKGIAKHLES